MEKKLEKPRRGRPPKKKVAPQEPVETVSDPLMPRTPEKSTGSFVFKSKFREDVVTLDHPKKTKHADVSTFIDPGKFAEFHRNTWTTEDPFLAQKLRDKIEERRNHDPLHIVETTV
jgi:hypothetical protein